MSTATPPLSLKKNVAWTFVGNVVSAACQWSILIALAKLGSAEIVGQYAMGLAVAGPILMFASMQLRKFQATDSRQEFRFGDYLGLVLLSSFVGWMTVTGVAWWDSDNLESLCVISVVGLSKAFELITDTFHGLLQQHERLDRITKSGILHSILSMMALCLGVWLTGSLLWGTIGYAAMRFLVLVTFDVPGALWVLQLTGKASDISRWQRLTTSLLAIRPRWEWSRLRPLAMLGLPMGVVSLLTSLQTNIPRYFVEAQLGKADLGMFCAIAALMTVGITLMRAIDQSSMPRLAKLYANGQGREFRWLFLKLMAIYLLLGVAGVWVVRWTGRDLLTLLFQAEYAIHTDVFETIMQATLAAYLVGAISSALMATRCIQQQLPLLCVSLLTAFGSGYWLVPEYGLWGAAMSMVLCKLPYIGIGSVMLFRATRENREPVILSATSFAPSAAPSLRRAA